jgi:hypothetical protein
LVTIQPETVPAASTAGIVTSCTWYGTSQPSCITSPGASATGTVTLTAPAPPGGAVIGLSVSGSRLCDALANPMACEAAGAWVPWAIFIPAGHVQAFFPVYAEKYMKYGLPRQVPCQKYDPITHSPMGMGWCEQVVEGAVRAVVQATYGGATKTAALSVSPGLDQPPPVCSGGSNLQFFGGIESGQYASIPAGRLGQPYLAQLFQGGREPSVFLSGGPGGLQLGKNGALSGVPTVPGQFKLNIQVAESCGGYPRFATATLNITETAPPQISSMTLTPNPLPANGGEVTLSVRAADNIGIARVLLTQIRPTGEQNSGTVPQVAGTPTNGEWRTQWRIAANSTTTPQTYTIKVKVSDAAGNTVEAEPIQLTVAGRTGQPPQIPTGSQTAPGQPASQGFQVPPSVQQGATPQGSQPPPQPPQGLQMQQAPSAAAQAPQGSQTLHGSQARPVPQATQPLQRPGSSPPTASVVGPGPAPVAPGGPVQSPAWWVLRPATAQDAPLAQSLNARLQESSRGWSAAARSVSVEVVNGAVRLSGKVPSAQERATIETAVRGTQGVRAVTNAITVGP